MDRTHARDNSHQATWQRLVEVHETMAANRMKFSITLSEMSDDLSSYVKEKEKIRRQLKETEMRYQKSIEDIEAALDKARYKYEVYSSEWEKLLIKSGNSRSDGASAVGVWAGPGAGSAPTSKSRNMGNAVTGIFSKHKGTVQENLERMGKEAEVKVKVANNNYRKLLNSTNAIRRDFYDVQLPKILASVMSLIEEVDECLKWSLGKYAYAYECAVLADALTLKPSNGDPGMMEMIEDIDSKTDLDNFLRFTAHQSGRVDRTSIPYKEYEM
ncbi:Rho GTPase-activating protein, partial [Linderina pennispora]